MSAQARAIAYQKSGRSVTVSPLDGVAACSCRCSTEARFLNHLAYNQDLQQRPLWEYTVAKQSRRKSKPKPPGDVVAAPPRIIGGKLRGRKLEYSGDDRTRPMKQRVREAVFNLIGTEAAGKFAIDLFAGTGALGFEALSRGADRALLIERHFPTADAIERNAASLSVVEQCEVFAGDTFHWWAAGPQLPSTPWVVFCSPPYALYVDEQNKMLKLITAMLTEAPSESLLVVESDMQFDPQLLPDAQRWDVRDYAPAVVAIYRKGE